MKLISNVSLFWYQRTCEWAIFLGLLFISLFAIASLALPDTPFISLPPAAIAAAVSAGVIGVAGRFFKPSNPTVATWIVFAFNGGAALVITATTGAITSPFAALWLLAGVGSGIVGLAGILLFLATNMAYFLLAVVLDWWSRPVDQILLIFIALHVPVLVGFLLWRAGIFKNAQGEAGDNALAGDLSREAIKSEVVINALAEGVIVVDKKGILQLINPAAQQLTGWGAGDSVQLDYHSVLKLATAQGKPIEGDDPIQQVLKTNKTVVNNELSLTTKEAKKRQLSLVVSPISNEEGAAGAIAVFRDITSEKAEEREKAEFISTASHEMRTPVASIEGYLALAMNPNVAQIDDKARAYLNKAHEATQHLGRLFQDLLTISRAEDGRLVNNPQLIDMTAFVRKLWEGQQPKAQAKGLQYTFMPQAGMSPEAAKTIAPILYTHFDPDRLSEVLNNLIDNAVKYTSEGEVSVDVTGDAENIIIAIKDSGIGIGKEDIPHLFQKFYRIDNSYTREVGGTGLGLYISRRIMEQSGGQIWVESEVGKGSTFYVQVPRIDNEKVAFLQQQAAAAQAAAEEAAKQKAAAHQAGQMPQTTQVAPAETTQTTQTVQNA